MLFKKYFCIFVFSKLHIIQINEDCNYAEVNGYKIGRK